MKNVVQIKVDFNFKKLTKRILEKEIFSVITDIANSAEETIKNRFIEETDINRKKYKPLKPIYRNYFRENPNNPILVDTGKLRDSVKQKKEKTKLRITVGSNTEYGMDHFQKRKGYSNVTIPARIWFYQSDNTTKKKNFEEQYVDEIKAFEVSLKNKFIPNFLRTIRTKFRKL